MYQGGPQKLDGSPPDVLRSLAGWKYLSWILKQSSGQHDFSTTSNKTSFACSTLAQDCNGTASWKECTVTWRLDAQPTFICAHNRRNFYCRLDTITEQRARRKTLTCDEG